MLMKGSLTVPIKHFLLKKFKNTLKYQHYEIIQYKKINKKMQGRLKEFFHYILLNFIIIVTLGYYQDLQYLHVAFQIRYNKNDNELMVSRKKSFLEGVFVDLLGTPVTMITGIIITPVYFKYINSNQYGIWTSALDYITLLTLMNAGINIQIIQNLSSFKKNKSEVNLSSILLYQILIILIGTLLSIIGLYYFPVFNQINESENFILLIIISLNLILITGSLNGWFNSVIQGQIELVYLI